MSLVYPFMLLMCHVKHVRTIDFLILIKIMNAFRMHCANVGVVRGKWLYNFQLWHRTGTLEIIRVSPERLLNTARVYKSAKAIC